MPKPSWYFQRLKTMSPLELPWRIWRMACASLNAYRKWPKATLLNYQTVWSGPCNVNILRHFPIDYPFFPNSSDISCMPDSWRNRCLLEANDYVDNRASFFNLYRYYLGDKIDWRCDYISGRTSPLSYAERLDYRDQKKVGDVKVVWELSRMQHLTRLAQAWCISGDERYPRKIEEQITDWIVNNPWMMGINWISPMECALRVITWTWSFHLIRNWDELTDEFCQLLVISINQHLKSIDNRYSLFSSANNHLIAEASGVYLAASYWSGLKSTERLKKRAKTHLLRECLRQNTSDGVNVEQSFAYTFFVWDLLLLPALMGRAIDDAFPKKYWDRLERITEFMAWVSDSKGNTPNVGDQDDGKVLNLTRGGDKPVNDMLAVAGAVFNRSDFLQWSGGRLSEKAFWFLGVTSNISTSKISTRKSRSFIEGGYHVFRTGELIDKEVMLLFDVAQNGDAVTGVHGHADALSINLNLAGQPFFSDAGTFSYQDIPLRHYFRATAQHNTICFGEDDQTEYVNRFLWGKREKVELMNYMQTDDSYVVKGRVYWWTGSSHEREIVTDFNNSLIIVRDSWLSNKNARLNYTVAPDIEVEITGSKSCKLIGEKGELFIEFNQGELEVNDMPFSVRCYKKVMTRRIVVRLPLSSRELETRCSWHWNNRHKIY